MIRTSGGWRDMVWSPELIGTPEVEMARHQSTEPKLVLDEDRIDEAVLGLLYLTLHDDVRAWKTFDWDAMNRLHQKGMIDDPIGKARSIAFTEEGLERSRDLFMTMFTRRP